MISALAFGLAVLAVAGAVACWVAGAVFLGRALDALGDRGRFRWLSVAAWPVAYSRLPPAVVDDATPINAALINSANVNKALVALIACLMVAGAATSVATNLHRMAI